MDIEQSKKHIEDFCGYLAAEYEVKLAMLWEESVESIDPSNAQKQHMLTLRMKNNSGHSKQISFTESQLLACEENWEKLSHRIGREVVELCKAAT